MIGYRLVCQVRVISVTLAAISKTSTWHSVLEHRILEE